MHDRHTERRRGRRNGAGSSVLMRTTRSEKDSPLNGVIPGWTEGLQLMKVGDKFKFEIPAKLAYGADSPSDKIPPNSTLVFEVELLAIQ